MTKQKYTIDYLKRYTQENNIPYDSLIIEEWKGRNSLITGVCNTNTCSNIFTKIFRQLIVGCGPYCTSCSKQIQQEKTKKTNLEIFGVKNPMQSEEIRNKGKITNLKLRGVEYPSQSNEIKEKKKNTCMIRYGKTTNLVLEEVKDKIKNTNIQKYGVENPSQSNDIKMKMKITNIKKRGVENPMQSKEVQNKSIITNLERYGVEYPVQLDTIKDKLKQTNLERYGVEYPMQNAFIAEKSGKNSYLIKNYILSSGKVIKVQGYEPFALDIIISSNIKEENIITSRKEVPEIWYYNSDKKKRYYVDIFIRSQNKCIEVKSTWTYQKDKYKIELVKKAVEESGYQFECWVFNIKKEMYIV